MKLWDKGYDTDNKIDEFTVGNDRHYDSILAQYDAQASIAHAEMLALVGLLDESEATMLVDELKIILNLAIKGKFQIEEDFEDMHSKIEYILTERLGDTGKKIHMARSRNDQVLVAVHLYLKDVIRELTEKTEHLFNILINLAEEHQSVPLPGYTHLQIAMPSSFGLWFSAHAESLIDDVYMLQAGYKIVNQNPLGSAAGYGSSFPIDRDYTTKALGFSTLKYNVVAAQMSRGKAERSIAMGMSQLAATLSKFAMDICLYMSQNFNFISFPDTLTTGSSIMPHKKNPDVFELVRAKCNLLQSLPNQFSLLTTNLPSGYHRDLQLCKEIFMPAVDNLYDCLDILCFSMPQINVNTQITEQSKYNYLYSVDNLNEMILREHIPFREAYKKIGKNIADGNYQPSKNIKHTHLGAKDNLCLDDIKSKMKTALVF